VFHHLWPVLKPCYDRGYYRNPNKQTILKALTEF